MCKCIFYIHIYDEVLFLIEQQQEDGRDGGKRKGAMGIHGGKRGWIEIRRRGK